MYVQGFSLTLLLTLSNVVIPENPSPQISLPAIDIGTTGSPAPFEGSSEGLVTVGNFVYVQEESREEPRQRRSCFSVPRNTH